MNKLTYIRKTFWEESCMGFKILFLRKIFKPGGKGAQGQSVNHQVYEGEK